MRVLLLCVLVSLAAASLRAIEPAPDWALHSTASLVEPSFLGTAGAVLRQSDEWITIAADGTFVTERRVILDILRSDGTKWAKHADVYNAVSDEVLEAQAWVIREGRPVDYKAKRDWLDLTGVSDSTVIDETRKIFINLEGLAIKGDLVVFLTKIQTKEFLGDRFFAYTSTPLPRAKATVRLKLPAGWDETHRSYGPLPAPNFTREGNVCHWTLAPLPFEAAENYSAALPSGLVVSLQAPGGLLTSFKDWTEVGGFVNRMQAPQCDTPPDLQKKVKALVSDATDDLARIRKIGTYVQNLRYVAINRNLALGHGYRPRLASEVLRVGYGDCKDKANLLQAMLKDAGIKSYLVLAEVENSSAVEESIPSLGWFDHAIIAIEVATVRDEWKFATVSHQGKNYLIFDPTDRFTVMGSLNAVLQGTRVFLCQDQTSGFVSLPTVEGERGFSLRREITVKLDRDGTATCQASILAGGQLASIARGMLELSETDANLEKFVTYQMSEGFRKAAIKEKKYTDDRVGGTLRFDFNCQLLAFAQPIPGGKAIVKVDLFSHRQTPSFPEQERHTPIRLDPLFLHDDVRLVLAPGLEVSDLPKSAELKSPFGYYALVVSRDNTDLTVSRQYELYRQVIPPSDFAALKQFLSAVSKADRSAAILKTGAQ